MDLGAVHDSLLEGVEEQLLQAAAAQGPEELGEPLEALTALFEGLGICHLLESLDVEEYRVSLTRAGYARRYFLRKCARAPITTDRRLALSRTDAVFDALAVGDDGLARDIADLSRADWNRDWEYRDDYCYFSLIHLFAGGRAVRSPGALLEEFEAALEGQRSVRLELCRALAERDESRFSEAWSELLEETRRSKEQERVRMVEPDMEAFLFWPGSFVSVEGLALLHVAELQGLVIDVEHPLCPAAARRIRVGTAVPDLFEEMELAREHPWA